MGLATRLVLLVNWSIMLAFFTVFLVKVAGPMFSEAQGMAVASGPFAPALDFIQTVSFVLLVPLFLLSVILWVVLGTPQEELERERFVRGRP